MCQKLLRRKHLELFGGKIIRAIDIVERLRLRSAGFGGDQYDAVAAAGAIDGGGRAAFEDVYGFDIVLVEVVDIAAGYSVDDIKRPQSRVARRHAPQLQRGRGIGVGGGIILHREPRHLTLDRHHRVVVGAGEQVFGGDVGDGARYLPFRDRAIADADYDLLFAFWVGDHRHRDIGPSFHRDLLVHITYVRDQQYRV